MGRFAAPRVVAFVVVGLFVVGVPPVWAEEYRLRVANLLESAYLHFNHVDVRTEPGAVGRLEGLSVALDQAAIPSGSFVSRDVSGAEPEIARPFAAVIPAGPTSIVRRGQWNEVVWQGQPGTRSVWLVRGYTLEYPELKAVGFGPRPGAQLANFLAYNATLSSMRTRVLRVPGALVESWEGRDGLWPKLARYMDPGQPVGVVVAISRDLIHPDEAVIVVEQPAQPATFDVVLAWSPRSRFPNFWNDNNGGADINSRTR